MAGTIRYLKEKVNPKCWIGTHFQELQNPDIIPNYRGLQYLQMDHVVQENSKGELEIVYLYKYVKKKMKFFKFLKNICF